MIKRYLLFSLSLGLIIFLLAGCSSFPTKKSTTAAKPQKGTYASVPAPLRQPVEEADMDLKQAKANLRLANELVKLAELKKEHAILKKKQADMNKNLNEIMVEKATVVVERKKLEAIDNANLGDKADNIKKIASLKTKELGIETEGVELKAEIATLDLDIKKLNEKINIQAGRMSASSGN